jgi:16S rRNA U516 pseudouridylate synthase RsuA-like enzyme
MNSKVQTAAHPQSSHRHLMLHKPYGVLSKCTDSEARPTLADYVVEPRVYPAGRLDMDSEGLLLLTSDGALAHRLTAPLHNISKTYLVQIERILAPEAPGPDSMPTTPTSRCATSAGVSRIRPRWPANMPP